MVVEFWVMRVLLHPGTRAAVRMSNLSPADTVTAMAHVAAGELCCLPDGCIAEPVEVFRSELDAAAHREKLLSDKPGADFRVVLNSSLDGGERA